MYVRLIVLGTGRFTSAAVRKGIEGLGKDIEIEEDTAVQPAEDFNLGSGDVLLLVVNDVQLGWDYDLTFFRYMGQTLLLCSDFSGLIAEAEGYSDSMNFATLEALLNHFRTLQC